MICQKMWNGKEHECILSIDLKSSTFSSPKFVIFLKILNQVHTFLSSFVYPGLDFLWVTWRMFLENQRMFTLLKHMFHAPCFQWSPSCSFSFVIVCIILVILCSLLWVSVFHVWSSSLDYFLLFSPRILVSLITLLYQGLCWKWENHWSIGS